MEAMPETVTPIAQTTQNRRTAYLVAGMHRSGTSAVTRLISYHGVSLPNRLMPPAPENNPKGFWESMLLMQVNDSILSRFGRKWDSWGRVDLDKLEGPAIAELISQIISALQTEYEGMERFVIKDPRVCLILPLYVQALREIGADIRVVLPIRNPLEVSWSLEKRNALPVEKTLMLWLRHTLDAEHYSRSLPRSICSYTELLCDWRALIARLSGDFGENWSDPSPDTVAEIETFISTSDRHHFANDLELDNAPNVVDWVKVAYRHFQELIVNPSDVEAIAGLDGIRHELSRAETALVPGFELEQNAICAKLSGTSIALDAKQAQVDKLLTDVSTLTAGLEATNVEAASLRERLTTADVSVQEANSKVGELTAMLAAMKEMVAERDTLVAQFSTSLQQALNAVANAEERVALLTSHQSTLEATLAQRSELIATLDGELADRQKVILESQRAHESLAARYNDLESLIEKRDDKIACLKEEVIALQDTALEYECTLDGVRGDVSALQVTQNELRARAEELEFALRLSIQDKVNMSHGLVWRLSRPIRSLLHGVSVFFGLRFSNYTAQPGAEGVFELPSDRPLPVRWAIVSAHPDVEAKMAVQLAAHDWFECLLPASRRTLIRLPDRATRCVLYSLEASDMQCAPSLSVIALGRAWVAAYFFARLVAPNLLAPRRLAALFRTLKGSRLRGKGAFAVQLAELMNETVP